MLEMKYSNSYIRGGGRHLDLGGPQMLNRIKLYCKNPIPVYIKSRRPLAPLPPISLPLCILG